MELKAGEVVGCDAGDEGVIASTAAVLNQVTHQLRAYSLVTSFGSEINSSLQGFGICLTLLPKVGVAITENHSIIFIDKVREGGGDRLYSAAHLLSCDRFCLEGDGGRRNVFVVNGSDAFGVVQSHQSDEAVHLQTFDTLVNGLPTGSVQEFAGFPVDFGIFLSEDLHRVLHSAATGGHEQDHGPAFQAIGIDEGVDNPRSTVPPIREAKVNHIVGIQVLLGLHV